MLHCDLTNVRNGFRLQVELQAHQDQVVGVVGPNGAGKTTLLRALAGLEPVQSGFIRVDDRVWADTATGIMIPPEQRNVGYVPQDGLLFPHMTILENVSFGLDKRADTISWLEHLGIAALANARPHELSGGQAQLVAFARAAARHPILLLLDEPLASVDVANRASIRRIVRRQLRESAGYRIFVTHDPLEAAALADHIVVLEEGRIIQAGSIADLRSGPRSPYVAGLVGVNFFSGDARSGVLTLEKGGRLVAAVIPDGPALATVHPRAVSLYRERPSGSPRNVWQARITSIEPSLEQVRIELAGPVPIVAEVTREGASAFAEGDAVWVAVKASEVVGYPQ